jgi:hypothetical protein
MPVRVAEHIAEQEDGALVGGEALEHDQERGGQRVRERGAFRQIDVLVDGRLRQPWSEVLLPLPPRRPQLVDRQSGRHGGQERLGRHDLRLAVQTQVRLLYDVLRVTEGA